MAKRDFYEVLGVKENASPDQIKKAFRALAKRYHPDANRDDPSAESRFKEANEAYEVLSDPKKRSQYDTMRKYGAYGMPGGGGGFPGGGYGPPPGGGGRVDPSEMFGGGQWQTFSGGGGLSDLFEQLFGGRSGPMGPSPGDDIQVALEIPASTAKKGGPITFTAPRRGPCPTCKGSGAAPGTSPETCPACKGRGTVAENRGSFSFSRTCPRCFGRGRIVTTPCPDCHGEGEKVVDKTFRVTIAPGSTDGTTLRLRGQGSPGDAGMPPGDLIVELRVPPDEFLRREGLDVVCTVELKPEQLKKGAKVKVRTREGKKAIVTVPPDTPSGTRLRLPGLGYALDGHRGDQIVEVVETEPVAEAGDYSTR